MVENNFSILINTNSGSLDDYTDFLENDFLEDIQQVSFYTILLLGLRKTDFELL